MLAATEELPKLQALSEACCNPTVTTTVKHHGLCFTGHEIQHEIFQSKFDSTSGPKILFYSSARHPDSDLCNEYVLLSVLKAILFLTILGLQWAVNKHLII